MLCPDCGYRLWNLASRTCPECGNGFTPSQFTFTPSSVQFCCPHCDQSYYGTDEKGHLSPREFGCVKCGNQLHMDEMVLRPASGVDEAKTQIEPMPWLRREQIGKFRALFLTTWHAMVRPGQLMQRTPANASLKEAIGYVLLLNVILLTGACIPIIFIQSAFMGFQISPESLGMGVLVWVMTVVIGLVAAAVSILLWGLAIQGVLKLGERTHKPFGQTLLALTYSSGANASNILFLFICFAPYFGCIWWIVSAVIALKERHAISASRASLAVLALPGVLTLIGIGFYAWFAFMVIDEMETSARWNVPVAASTRPAGTVASGLFNYVDRTGGFPPHAIALIEAGDLTARSVVPGSQAQELPIPIIGPAPITDWFSMSPDERDLATSMFASGIKPGEAAHRLGDFVFTYHGLPTDCLLKSGEDGSHLLWVVIQSADPDRNIDTTFNGMVYVGHCDGNSIWIPLEAFDDELEAQNQLRKLNGLPEIPHPDEVRHVPFPKRDR